MTDYPDVASCFVRDAASHQMTALHDDGLYRDLRFTNPDSTLYWYEITTTPGQLVFSGDGADSFVFRLAADALMAVLDYAYWLEPDKNPTGLKAFRFKYVHEWVLKDFDWWFLFALHAIKDAIARYDATICGSRCPRHPREHYCRRSPGHQAGICRDVQQKGQESCTWDPATNLHERVRTISGRHRSQ